MIVIATGPRSNGTSLLYRIIATGGGKTPLHLPAYPVEFVDQDWATDFPTALFVVVERGWLEAGRSMVARGFHASLDAAVREQAQAMGYLGRLVEAAPERCYHLRYRELVEHPEREVLWLTEWLVSKGYWGQPLSVPEPIVDGDAKWAAV